MIPGYNPRRLYRVTNADEPLFELYYGDHYTDDASITHMSLRRGSAGAKSGITSGTLEASTIFETDPAGFDEVVSVRLSTYALNMLGLPVSCLWRWVGRTSGQSVTDTADGRTTAFQGAVWSGQVPAATTDQVMTKSAPDVGQMLKRAWDGVKLPATLTAARDTDDAYFGAGVASFAVPAADVWGKWCRDLGILVRTLRTGHAEMLPLAARTASALDWRSVSPVPITRRVCDSPVTWRQSPTNPAAFKWTYRQPDAAEFIFTWPAPGTYRPTSTTEVDTTHVLSTTESVRMMLYATAWDSFGGVYAVDAVTIDLLALIASGVPVDHRLLVQLLTMEEGDPVALSYDWPAAVAGVYFATEILEEITPDSWTITLTLDSMRTVTATLSPDVSGDTWDTRWSASASWDSPGLPDGTTWDTI